ncbi:MAG: hypothetical protein RLP44_04660 [Aggregatilineales bacterium]
MQVTAPDALSIGGAFAFAGNLSLCTCALRFSLSKLSPFGGAFGSPQRNDLCYHQSQKQRHTARAIPTVAKPQRWQSLAVTAMQTAMQKRPIFPSKRPEMP